MFCLLGGHGISAEIASATHAALLTRVSINAPTVHEVEQALVIPVRLTSGHEVRYRFWRQRSQRIVDALDYLRHGAPPDDPLELRRWLMGIRGVGPKTASWIVRNVTGSNEVAIIDIWVVRAMLRAGVFPQGWDLARHYGRYESAFLAYASAANVPASALDWCVWELGRQILPFLPAPRLHSS